MTEFSPAIETCCQETRIYMNSASWRDPRLKSYQNKYYASYLKLPCSDKGIQDVDISLNFDIVDNICKL